MKVAVFDSHGFESSYFLKENLKYRYDITQFTVSLNEATAQLAAGFAAVCSGIVGTGKIGSVMTKIMSGFGCKVVAFDKKINHEIIKNYDVLYLPLDV